MEKRVGARGMKKWIAHKRTSHHHTLNGSDNGSTNTHILSCRIGRVAGCGGDHAKRAHAHFLNYPRKRLKHTSHLRTTLNNPYNYPILPCVGRLLLSVAISNIKESVRLLRAGTREPPKIFSILYLNRTRALAHCNAHSLHISPFQEIKRNWNAVTFLNQTASRPSGPDAV
jgi:hypothetical protein